MPADRRGQDGDLLAPRAPRAQTGAGARAPRGAARRRRKDKLERALEGASVVALERGAERAGRGARSWSRSIRSLHEERLGARARGPRLRARHLRRVPPRRRRRQPARAAPARRVRARRGTGTLLGFTATTARGDGKGLDAGVRAHRLLAHAARADRRRLPRPAPGLPHRDRRRPDAAVVGGLGSSARTSSRRRSTSRSATPSWRARSRSSRATAAPSRSA